MRLVLFLSLLTFLLISCSEEKDGGDDVKKCGTCKEWQKCDLSKGVCILKENRCNNTNDCQEGECNHEHKCIVNKCKGVDCSGHGDCRMDGENAICDCHEGYMNSGNGLECSESPCKDVDCDGHGECVVFSGNPKCNCYEGYTQSADKLHCEDGACTPSCNGKECGSDGCGGICGTCEPGETCSATGQCEDGTCNPSCNGKQCGEDDGCGGKCDGSCDNGKTCVNFECVDECTPSCNGKECGSDGCGGTCGSCEAGKTCNASGQCDVACTPSCNGKECGSDGCGGSCGTCEAGKTCNASGQCEAGSSELSEGDIIITEVMANPKTVADSKGEWLEIYNTTNNNIDLTGLKVVKQNTNDEDEYEVEFTNGANISSNSYLLIVKTNEALLENISALSAFSLANSSRTIRIKLGDLILDSFTYPKAKDGKSWQLSSNKLNATDNDNIENWCVSTSEGEDAGFSAGNTDKGTPGKPNLECPSE